MNRPSADPFDATAATAPHPEDPEGPEACEAVVTDAARVAEERDAAPRAADAGPALTPPPAAGEGLGSAAGAQEARAAAEATGCVYLDHLRGRRASAVFLERVPIHFAREHRLLGLAREEGEDQEALPLAVCSLRCRDQLDVLSRYLGTPVRPIFTSGRAILEAIGLAYQQRTGQAAGFIEKLETTGDKRDVLAELQALAASGGGGGSGGREDLLDTSGRAPVIQLVNLMLFEAVQQEASDAHVQPYEDKLVVRLRIDGVLFDAFELPKAVQEEVVSRVKVMGRMNIAEKRLAQDGRATVQVGDRLIDLRIASVPTAFGERIVLRLLDKSARLYRLPELGMAPRNLETFRRLIGVEHGLVLVTGPTGSGKSTTLYAALQELNAKELNVITLEDPIEYQLPGVSQIQVSDKKGMTFAGALRSVLRQDPDIIMVGEIRDRETATMAIQSALTGHLVFSTLHTNDAASAVTRLLDLGIEPYLVASSVVGVLAQRLVRKTCLKCARPATASDAELERLGVTPEPPESPETPKGMRTAQLRRGTGCPACRGTGFRGRVGIFELMVVDDPVRLLVQQPATAGQIRESARARGMTTLQDDGVARALAGVTTLEEVLRVTMRASQ